MKQIKKWRRKLSILLCYGMNWIFGLARSLDHNYSWMFHICQPLRYLVFCSCCHEGSLLESTELFSASEILCRLMGRHYYLSSFSFSEFSQYRYVANFLNFHPSIVFLQDSLRMLRPNHSSFSHFVLGKDPN